MISMKEITNKDLDSLPDDIAMNLNSLLEKMNLIRNKYGKPMTVTSGFRTKEDHLRIYAEKGITDPKKIPMGSKHLSGLACDISDPNSELYKWCLANEDYLIQIGVWLEHRQGPWQHFQIEPFKSYQLGGTIWFHP